ncbi:hypothetical protein DAEQUDRAFT_82015 [Daedalea quercina L-15889]|uniref:Uncharacterized protein n=1 Tax=Daedalea quercina L-15889 TaxID=1314783 RepID=A0A165SHF4_9APHY|nr:hypothetical protein DAEQUDRAFT_82015 [Daedalea quercina L-15889]
MSCFLLFSARFCGFHCSSRFLPSSVLSCCRLLRVVPDLTYCRAYTVKDTTHIRCIPKYYNDASTRTSGPIPGCNPGMYWSCINNLSASSYFRLSQNTYRVVVPLFALGRLGAAARGVGAGAAVGLDVSAGSFVLERMTLQL